MGLLGLIYDSRVGWIHEHAIRLRWVSQSFGIAPERNVVADWSLKAGENGSRYLAADRNGATQVGADLAVGDFVELSLVFGERSEVRLWDGSIRACRGDEYQIAQSQDDLLALSYVRSLLSSDNSLSTGGLSSDRELRAWLRACLKLSAVFTPWFPWNPGIAKGAYNSILSVRPYPSAVSATIRSEHCVSYERLFAVLGEQLFGIGGYSARIPTVAGRSLRHIYFMAAKSP